MCSGKPGTRYSFSNQLPPNAKENNARFAATEVWDNENNQLCVTGNGKRVTGNALFWWRRRESNPRPKTLLAESLHT